MNDLKKLINHSRQDINKKLKSLLSPTKKHNKSLLDAMTYSSLSPGKRLRSFLILSISSILKVPKEFALRVASACEFVHTYSLIHDDLPSMDDANLRRGKQSCHIAFNEATAILAGDALLTLAFEIIAHEKTHPNPLIRCKLSHSLAKAIGFNGMVAGQMLDIESEKKTLNIEEITNLQNLKTGNLFNFSCIAPCILSSADKIIYQALEKFSYNIGLVFQITDDLLNHNGDTKIIGKPTNIDEKKHKKTFVSILGTNTALKLAKTLTEQAINSLNPLKDKANFLKKFAYFIIKRNR